MLVPWSTMQIHFIDSIGTEPLDFDLTQTAPVILMPTAFQRNLRCSTLSP